MTDDPKKPLEYSDVTDEEWKRICGPGGLRPDRRHANKFSPRMFFTVAGASFLIFEGAFWILPFHAAILACAIWAGAVSSGFFLAYGPD